MRPAPIEMKPIPEILAFDVFGTVVDWYGSIVRELDTLDLGIDSCAFTLAWWDDYGPSIARVRSGELPWTGLDELHRESLDKLLLKYGILTLNDAQKAHLNRVWHRLKPWSDSVEGLSRLKKKFTICTLSNGNIGLLTNMAKRAKLPWDCILSAEVFCAYKPHPSTYGGVARIFDVDPSQVMLVAAHHPDLAGARACGLQTAYVQRPGEFGPFREKDISSRPDNDYHAESIIALADQLMCLA